MFSQTFWTELVMVWLAAVQNATTHGSNGKDLCFMLWRAGRRCPCRSRSETASSEATSPNFQF